MKKIFIFAMAAAFGFTACQKEEGTTVGGPIDDGTVKTIVANGGQALTKIRFANGFDADATSEPMIWKTGDKLIVFELAEIPAGNSKGFTGYTMASTAGGATTTTNSTAKAVLTFTLIDGAETSVATFGLDGEGSGLEKDKKYIAFHSPTNKTIGVDPAAGVIRPVSDAGKLGEIYGFRIQALNGGNATSGSTSLDSKANPTGDWALWASEQSTFWAVISFDVNEEMNPVIFKPTVQRYMDVAVKLDADVTSAVRFNSVKIAASSDYLLSHGHMSIVDQNLELKGENVTNAYKGGFTFTRTDGRVLDQDPVAFRIPFTMPHNAAGNVTMNFELTLTVDGSSKTITRTKTKTAKDASTPAFEIGKVYGFSEPFTITQAELE